jgi:hypothetical protein
MIIESANFFLANEFSRTIAMKILHGTWIPSATDEFILPGSFCLWVETSTPKQSKSSKQRHPAQLGKEDLSSFLVNELGVSESSYNPIASGIVTQYFLLPSSDDEPLPSLELSRYLESESPEPSRLEYWEIDCYEVKSVIKLLNDLHFLAVYNSNEIQIGSDLLFWYHYTQFFKQVIFKDQYIPALKYREVSAKKGKQKTKSFEIYTGWSIVSEQYESSLREYLDYIPLACVAGTEKIDDARQFYDKEKLLRHFSECLLTEIVTNARFTKAFEQKIKDGERIF